jgi:hypothetical protein
MSTLLVGFYAGVRFTIGAAPVVIIYDPHKRLRVTVQDLLN